MPGHGKGYRLGLRVNIYRSAEIMAHRRGAKNITLSVRENILCQLQAGLGLDLQEICRIYY